ncbi:unnamed protein product [Ambrosiozyma monospora]|uniref:Unnamed protein product n=1 Tax=Ambrosiozyma monospora TaxID=43982 RepID=A0ACB5TDJ1_AMBMO|nr:unnamed protein product [Ambrosiozyma monospora]
MQFSILTLTLSALASTALAVNNAVSPARLYVNSTAPEVFGAGIYARHEGAGIDYLFLGQGADILVWDGEQVYTNKIGYSQYFNVDSNFVQLTVDGKNSKPISFTTIEDKNYLTVDGKLEGFFACKNTDDSYQYSKDSYELMYYPDGSEDEANCLAVNVYRAGFA